MRTRNKVAIVLVSLLALVACNALRPRQGWSAKNGPVVPHDTFPADCALCHEGPTWNKLKKDFSFDHEKMTGVALNGAHAQAACLRCHNDRGPVQAFASRGCAGCHQDPHRSRLGARCQDCHTETSWRVKEEIATHARTRFPLVGAHTAVSCTECHKGALAGQFEGLSPRCDGCHSDDITRSTSLNHASLGLTSDCQRCHIATSWKSATFAHPSSFPLQGGHGGHSCNACHTTPGTLTGLSTTCSSCHTDDFQRTTNPNHAAASFGTTCNQCHGTTTWQGAIFNHVASFPLTLGHAGRSCNSCHTGGTYTGLSNDCASCHLDNYQATTNPNHAAASFPTTCVQCHNTRRWDDATFAHPATFPLTNGHAGRACASCHTTPGVYTGLTTTCSSCHLDDFQRTTSPNHANAGFATNCTQCHTTTQWQGASFVHTSRFPLTNSHSGVSCTRCHTTPGVYTGLTNQCSSCHLDDYQRTTNPNHVTAGFPTNCTQCHGTTTWQGATFTHPSSFPLTNGHAGQTCSRCHTTPGVYTGLSTACSSCHMPDFQATTNPRHVTGAFSTTCNQCHNTTTWNGANFPHTSAFPLTNAHAGRACTACHTTPGVYTGLNNQCSTCHLSDYQATTNPNHASSGFPTTCNTCHGTTTWSGATFNHTRFPITSGPHRQACAECHRTPGQMQLFSCTHCHAHNQTEMNNQHRGRSGYSWTSTACYQCHPNGRS